MLKSFSSIIFSYLLLYRDSAILILFHFWSVTRFWLTELLIVINLDWAFWILLLSNYYSGNIFLPPLNYYRYYLQQIHLYKFQLRSATGRLAIPHLWRDGQDEYRDSQRGRQLRHWTVPCCYHHCIGRRTPQPRAGRLVHGPLRCGFDGTPGGAPCLEGGGDQHTENTPRNPPDAIQPTAGVSGQRQLRQAAGGRQDVRRFG